MFRDALAHSLRAAFPGAEVIETDTLPDALTVARERAHPALFVFDLMFPGMDGPSSISAVRREFPAASIVIVTMLEDPKVAEQILEAGADGFLGKGLSSASIIDGIKAVRAGEFVVNMAASGHNMTFDKPVLTDRQQEILQLLAEGKSNKLIARCLGLSHFTVRNHVTILMRSLNVQRRDQLSQRAQALGLSAPSDPEC